MPIASKRNGSQQTIHRQQQSIPQDNGYDDYAYYPYYSKTAPDDGYEYAEESDQYEEQPAQYHKTRTSNNSAPIQRT